MKLPRGISGNCVIRVLEITFMEFEVLFTMDATDAAAQMSRGSTYWPRFVIQNLHGIVVVFALFIYPQTRSAKAYPRVMSNG